MCIASCLDRSCKKSVNKYKLNYSNWCHLLRGSVNFFIFSIEQTVSSTKCLRRSIIEKVVTFKPIQTNETQKSIPFGIDFQCA